MKEEEAVKALEDAKLKVEIIEETSKKVQAGYVISQETDAETEVNADDTVKIHVSIGTGIKQITMIDVKGKTEAEAKSALEKLGLVVNIASSEDRTKDNGVVLTQSIEAGKVIDEGTTVTITVNKLAEVKSVPITVNVKSLLDGDIYENSTSENQTDKKVKEVKLRVTVGEDTIFSKKVKASETAIAVGNAKGTGTTTVKVYIDDVLKNDGGYTLVFSNVSSYTAE